MRIYWDCEFAAMQGVIDFYDAAACSAAYERLMADEFGGDFERFLAWWKKNRRRELTARMNPRNAPNSE
jgi:hypothetical protein